MPLSTPYYLIDEAKLQQKLDIIQRLRDQSGAKVLLALKCFATWSAFEQMARHMDGTTSSSLYEVRLGREHFGGETHAYSVAYADEEIEATLACADKIIFNSISQLQRYEQVSAGHVRGLRVNPGISNSPYLLADPSRPHSRLGESDPARIATVMDRISGFMFHNNCENRDFAQFCQMLDHIEQRFGALLPQAQWVSLGGGIDFTGPDYPLDAFAQRLRQFSERWGVQVYLEPGETAVAGTTTLEVSVLDVIDHGDKQLAVVDSSIEAHMLDLLVYQLPATILPNEGPHEYMVCGKSCLAGDIFGEFRFAQPLAVGDRLSIQEAAGYTMVKKNWFNGVKMPAIAIRRHDGRIDVIRKFDYADYVQSLS